MIRLSLTHSLTHTQTNTYLGTLTKQQPQYREALTKTAFDISIQWSGVARLFLISSMLYSLKDAGEKDLLSDPTFVRMNFMLASWGFLGKCFSCIFSLNNAS